MPKSIFTSIGLKHQIIIKTIRDQDTKIAWVTDKLSGQAIIQSQTKETRPHYPNMLSTNKLSQHGSSQVKARKARHVIPACSSLDKLSQHAVSQSKARKARHVIPTCSGSQSQHVKARHAIPAYTEQACYPSIHCTS